MTDKERLIVALLISLALHYVLLGGLKAPRRETPSDGLLIVNLARPNVGVSFAAPMTLEQIEEQPVDPEQDAADRRRAALSRYLDDVYRAIHDRRMRAASDRSNLVGNVLFSLTIDGDGVFRDISMLRGSGESELDRDAEQAVHAASGAVPRPRLLGRSPLNIRVAVKYQFGL